MYEIGRICIKTAGRDAGNFCVIVDILDDKLVLIDGNVRRRKCNIMHLEPTNKTIKIAKKASHDSVKAEFQKLELETWETKPRKTGERPKKIRGKKKAQEPKEAKKKVGKKKAKTEVKKEEPKAEKKEESVK